MRRFAKQSNASASISIGAPGAALRAEHEPKVCCLWPWTTRTVGEVGELALFDGFPGDIIRSKRGLDPPGDQMTGSIGHAKSDEQIAATFDVMRQLRPDIERDDYVALISGLMQSDGVRLQIQLISKVTRGESASLPGAVRYRMPPLLDHAPTPLVNVGRTRHPRRQVNP